MKYLIYFLLGIVTGIFFLIIGQPMLLICSFLLFTLSLQNSFQKLSNKINIPLMIKLVILMILVGFVTEFLAIWNNVNLTPEQITEANSLYSTDPLTDIVLGWGYYIPLAIVWFFLLRKYDYRTRDVFISMGLFGVVFEGQGLILLSFNPLLWAYAFMVHGSYIAIAHLIIKVDPFLINNNRKSISSLKKYTLGFLYALLVNIPFVIWHQIITAFI